MPYGTQQYGQTQYAGASGITELVSATPVSFTVVRLVYGEAMKRNNPLGLDDATNPINYTITGGPRTITVKTVTEVDPQTFDAVVDEMTNGASYVVTVAGTVTDQSGTDSIAATVMVVPTADNASFTGLGELPRLVSVENTAPGTLKVSFSEPLLNDGNLQAISSYSITPIGESVSLFIEAVTVGVTTNQVTLTFQGGPGTYKLTVTGVTDEAFNIIDPSRNFAVFAIGQASVDELFDGDNLYFDTNLGTIRLSFNSLSRRKIEDLVIQRARSTGHAQQFQQIATSLKNSGVNRDETRLKLFKG